MCSRCAAVIRCRASRFAGLAGPTLCQVTSTQSAYRAGIADTVLQHACMVSVSSSMRAQALSLCIADGRTALAQGLKALYPEWGGPGAVEVVPADLVRLQPGEFLNDTIIDFYMRCGPSCHLTQLTCTFIWGAGCKSLRSGCPPINSTA